METRYAHIRSHSSSPLLRHLTPNRSLGSLEEADISSEEQSTEWKQAFLEKRDELQQALKEVEWARKQAELIVHEKVIAASLVRSPARFRPRRRRRALTRGFHPFREHAAGVLSRACRLDADEGGVSAPRLRGQDAPARRDRPPPPQRRRAAQGPRQPRLNGQCVCVCVVGSTAQIETRKPRHASCGTQAATRKPPYASRAARAEPREPRRGTVARLAQGAAREPRRGPGAAHRMMSD